MADPMQIIEDRAPVNKEELETLLNQEYLGGFFAAVIIAKG